MSELSRALYLWSKCDPKNQEKLRTWLDDAVTKCAAGQGQTLMSSTANNVSVSFMSNSMTIAQWLVALSDAVQLINSPTSGRKKAVQIFR